MRLLLAPLGLTVFSTTIASLMSEMLLPAQSTMPGSAATRPSRSALLMLHAPG